MNQEERKTAIRRMRVLVAAACILMLLYGLRLIFLQLVNGDDFKSQATNTTDYKFTVTAARGDIVDSRGERIATSVTGYNVVLNKLLMGDEDLDGMLQKIVELLRANGESWNDTLLISQPDAAGNYTFTAEAGSTRDQKALAAMKDNLGLQQYATANDVMEKLVEDYDLASYPLSWQRTLGGIHYEMQLQAFSNVNNFIMAENVSEATVATIKEHSLSLPGVEIVETSTRSYEQSTVLPHVLGRVGKITAEKWKVTDENGQTTYPLREKGYNMNDIIGISGLESAYEDELRGKDGVETITRNSDGVIVDTALTTVPEPGHTVQLTIDSRFQKAVDKALAENIDMINRVYNTGSMKAAACAAVVLDVKDGSVLAASNYPSFARPILAKRVVEIARAEGADAVCHGSTGKGNDQVRFELAIMHFAPDLKIITPWREWDIQSRDEEIDYAEAHHIPLKISRETNYSKDKNLWHLSHEGLDLEDPGNEPPYDKPGFLELGVSPKTAPDKSEFVELEFEQGVPVALNGEKLKPATIIAKLNEIGGRNGVGLYDVVENRLVGMKSRGVYETPGGTILYKAHEVLETLTLDKLTAHKKRELAITFGELVYDGQWFSPLRKALSAFVTSTQEHVTGKVRLELYKGNLINAGVWSPYSLYREDIATFAAGGDYKQSDATGFISIYGLPTKVQAIVNSEKEGE